MKYRSKPTEVDAVQWTGHNFDAIATFVGSRTAPRPLPDAEDDGIIWIWVLKSAARCAVVRGDWVVAEPDGIGFYPCNREIFEKRWQLVDDASQRRFPDLIRLVRSLDYTDPHFSLTIDGEEFPWVVLEDDPFVVEVIGEGPPRLRLTLPANRVELVDDLGEPKAALTERQESVGVTISGEQWRRDSLGNWSRGA